MNSLVRAEDTGHSASQAAWQAVLLLNLLLGLFLLANITESRLFHYNHASASG